MNDLKLSIDLLPKGAWSNNLRTTLTKGNWDVLRQRCYRRFNYTCAICGDRTVGLDAHEVWDFDIENQTQTLKDIIALCPACHGVKHMRNSQRIGYGKNATRHFLKINNCDELTFAKHYLEAQLLFDERNKVLRWSIQADLSKFGGGGFEIAQRNIPIISNPYDGVDWLVAGYSTSKDEIALSKSQTSPVAMCPKIRSIEVDNYQGSIIVVADFSDKIEWIANNEILKTKYNCAGRLSSKFDVERLDISRLHFVLTNSSGKIASQEFGLNNT